MNPNNLPKKTATNIIVLINVTIFIAILFLSRSHFSIVLDIYEKFALSPRRFMEGAVWQVFTSFFLHAYIFPISFLHIAGNMIGVFSLGNFLESTVGKKNFVFLYFISGLSASLLIIYSALLSGDSQDMIRSSIGASGALLGLIGALAVFSPKTRVIFFVFPLSTRKLAVLVALFSIVFEIF